VQLEWSIGTCLRLVTPYNTYTSPLSKRHSLYMVKILELGISAILLNPFSFADKDNHNGTYMR
jgi:hypothetical protein